MNSFSDHSSVQSSYKAALHEHVLTYPGSTTCELRLSRVVAFTRTLRYVVSSHHFSLINRVAVDAPTSAVLRIEGLQAVPLPGTLESSSKLCRRDQPTLGLGWHGAEHGYPHQARPARFHLGTEPSATCVNISACTEPVPNPR